MHCIGRSYALHLVSKYVNNVVDGQLCVYILIWLQWAHINSFKYQTSVLPQNYQISRGEGLCQSYMRYFLYERDRRHNSCSCLSHEYLLICACMNTPHMYIHTCTCTHAHTPIHIHMHKHTCTYTHTHIHMHNTYMHIHTYTQQLQGTHIGLHTDTKPQIYAAVLLAVNTAVTRPDIEDPAAAVTANQVNPSYVPLVQLMTSQAM